MACRHLMRNMFQVLHHYILFFHICRRSRTMDLHWVLYSITLLLVHTAHSLSQCWQKGKGVTSTLDEILKVETIEHCETVVRVSRQDGRPIKSVSFVSNGYESEGFCKMSNRKNFHKEDSAYFALVECLSPSPGMLSQKLFRILFRLTIYSFTTLNIHFTTLQYFHIFVHYPAV